MYKSGNPTTEDKITHKEEIITVGQIKTGVEITIEGRNQNRRGNYNYVGNYNCPPRGNICLEWDVNLASKLGHVGSKWDKYGTL